MISHLVVGGIAMLIGIAIGAGRTRQLEATPSPVFTKGPDRLVYPTPRPSETDLVFFSADVAHTDDLYGNIRGQKGRWLDRLGNGVKIHGTVAIHAQAPPDGIHPAPLRRYEVLLVSGMPKKG